MHPFPPSLQGAVMIARYMKLQRGNTLVHCSDGWDRTSQLTSLAQIIMDPYYRTLSGLMVRGWVGVVICVVVHSGLIVCGWLAL
jgi:hypothetical protein